MRVFKNKSFARFARKEHISDNELWEIIDILESNLAEADLGGGVYKVRQARSGEGKSGGYRVIAFFKSKFRTIFVYGFAKSKRSNIEDDELQAFKYRAKDYFLLTDEQINARIKQGTLIEVFKEAKDEI